MKEYGLREAFESARKFDEWWHQNVSIDVREEVMYLGFRNDYPIDLKKIKTHQDILSLTHHLLGKRWVSEMENGPYVLSKVISTICALKRLKLYE